MNIRTVLSLLATSFVGTLGAREAHACTVMSEAQANSWMLGYGIQDSSYLGPVVGGYDATAFPSSSPTGYFQQFQNATVWLDGCYEVGGGVMGAILGHYNALGDASSFLAYPNSDEEAAPGGGRVSYFEYGAIFWTASTGAWSFHGWIWDKLWNMGQTGGPLGFPTSDEQSWTYGTFNAMQNGMMVFNNSVTPFDWQHTAYPVLSTAGSWGGVEGYLYEIVDGSYCFHGQVSGFTDGDYVNFYNNRQAFHGPDFIHAEVVVNGTATFDYCRPATDAGYTDPWGNPIFTLEARDYTTNQFAYLGIVG